MKMKMKMTMTKRVGTTGSFARPTADLLVLVCFACVCFSLAPVVSGSQAPAGVGMVDYEPSVVEFLTALREGATQEILSQPNEWFSYAATMARDYANAALNVSSFFLLLLLLELSKTCFCIEGSHGVSGVWRLVSLLQVHSRLRGFYNPQRGHSSPMGGRLLPTEQRHRHFVVKLDY